MSDALARDLDAIVFDRDIALASLAVAVIKSGRVLDLRGVDNRPPGPPSRLPITADSLFRIASISKLICAVGALRMMEQGALSLDGDVSEWLGWRLRNPMHPNVPVTIAQILSHTSSLRDDAGYNFAPNISLRSVLEGSPKAWDSRAPGAYFQYANLPWGLLATVMERVSNERFDHLINRLVLTPLKLEGGFHPALFSQETLARTVTLYRKRNANEVWDPTGPWVPQVDDYANSPPAPRADANYVPGTNGTVMSPQGGARLSVRSLAVIARLLLGKGEVDGVRLLKPETVALMLSKRWNRATDAGASTFDEGVGSIAAWGLGVQHFIDSPGTQGDRLVEGGGFSGVGHFGFAYGLTSALVIDPVTHNGLIYCSGGVANDPEKFKGVYSSNYRFEERIFTALWKRSLSSE